MAMPAHPTAEPNVTPMIDVLLVLLIVFMVVVVESRRRAMDVVLPEACAGTCRGGDAIVLEVLPGPVYRLNRQPVRHDQLLTVLSTTYTGRPDKVLSVAGRPGVTYAEVVEAMDVARAARVRILSAVPKGF